MIWFRVEFLSPSNFDFEWFLLVRESCWFPDGKILCKPIPEFWLTLLYFLARLSSSDWFLWCSFFESHTPEIFALGKKSFRLPLELPWLNSIFSFFSLLEPAEPSEFLFWFFRTKISLFLSPRLKVSFFMVKKYSRLDEGDLLPREVFVDSIFLCSSCSSDLGDRWLLEVSSEPFWGSVRALKNESILADFWCEV